MRQGQAAGCRAVRACRRAAAASPSTSSGAAAGIAAGSSRIVWRGALFGRRWNDRQASVVRHLSGACPNAGRGKCEGGHDERRRKPGAHAAEQRRRYLLLQPRHHRDALRRRARPGARDALRARPVRGRGDRRRRRLCAHGRQAGGDAAALRARARATGWRICTTRGAPRRRWSTSSATTPPITARSTRR